MGYPGGSPGGILRTLLEDLTAIAAFAVAVAAVPLPLMSHVRLVALSQIHGPHRCDGIRSSASTPLLTHAQSGSTKPNSLASSSARCLQLMILSLKTCSCALMSVGGPRSRNSRDGGRNNSISDIRVARENIT